MESTNSRCFIVAVLLIKTTLALSNETKFGTSTQSVVNNTTVSISMTQTIEIPLLQFNTTNDTTGQELGNGTNEPDHQAPSGIVAGYITVPVLLAVGLFGNGMSIVVMTRKEFRKMTMTIILIALAFSDSLLIIMQPNNKPYVRRFLGTDLRSYGIISCKIFYWFFRTAKMTSSWLIVLIASERLVAVWFPLKAKVINSEKNIIMAVVLVYVAIGSFNGIWGSFADILVLGNCLPNKAFPHLANVAKSFVVAGTLIYAIVPSCIVFTMNVMIIGKLAMERRRRMHMVTESGAKQQQSRMTAMLLGVSITFVLLVIPIAILHSMATFSGFNPFISKEPAMMITREVIQTMEQLNYSINFYLYVLCSKPFRDTVGRLLTCRRSSDSENFTGLKHRHLRVRKVELNDQVYPPVDNTEVEYPSEAKVNEKSQGRDE